MVLRITSTEEAKQKMSELRKGKFTGEFNHFYGKTHSEEIKQQLSSRASERVGDKNAFYGKKHSAESRSKMSINYKKKDKFLTEQDIEDIKYKKNVLGMTYKEISKEYGIYWGTISKAARGTKAYASVKQITPPIRTKAAKLSEEQIKDIKHRYFVLKQTFKEIAKQYNMQYRTISEAAQDKGTYAPKLETKKTDET